MDIRFFGPKPNRWWKNSGNLVVRLPGGFLPCRRKDGFYVFKNKREEKSGSPIFRKTLVIA